MSHSLNAGQTSDLPLVDSPGLDTTVLNDYRFFQQSPTITVGLLAVVVLLAARLLTRRKLPPGSKPLPRLPGLPWAGRFWDVPEEGIEAAYHFGALHKKHGPIYEWKVMGTTHIWIETDKIARDLFVRRQRLYCDRNSLPAALGVKEDCEILPLSAYSEDFKRHKNFIHAIMKNANPKAFYGWPALENKRTLIRLLQTPNRWSEHMITHCARTIASIAWGDPEHGPLINKLTFLQNLPAFMSPWKKFEARRKQDMQDAFYEALDDVKQRLDRGQDAICWSKLWLEQDKGVEAFKLDWHEAAYAIGSSSFVAIATIGGPLHAFFVALCQYPDWLPVLQEEIDRVCGDHLPAVEHMPQMPKLRATISEVLRWRQSTPLGVPHEVMEDDIYEGYHIPKGAMCHANHYLISREEPLFPRGNEFIPERWLDPKWPSYKEPLTEFPNLRGHVAFGYGSRACPGVDLTNMELFTLLGALAWAFDISPKEPRDKVPYYEVNKFVITMSKPFPVNIVPRSEKKRRFIEDLDLDPGYTLTDKKASKWDMIHEADGGAWTWEGLAPRYETPAVPKVYPAGA